MSLSLVRELASPEPQHSPNGLFQGNVFPRPRISVSHPQQVPCDYVLNPPCWRFLVLPEICFVPLWPLPSQENRTTYRISKGEKPTLALGAQRTCRSTRGKISIQGKVVSWYSLAIACFKVWFICSTFPELRSVSCM